jgi:dolichol kinase
MDNKIDWHEIRRKIFHILGGIALALLVYFDILNAIITLIIVIFGIILSALYKKYDLPIISYFLNRYEREHLKKKYPGKGVIFLFMAILLMMILFEKNIVIAGIMIWAFGDGMSAIIGKHYGQIKHVLNNNKHIEGTIAGIIFGTIAASFFVYWLYALIACTIAMIVESIDWKIYPDAFDDNLLVPLIGSAAIYLLMITF